MIIIALRTDKPESEIGVYDGDTQLIHLTWEAHRMLAETIHSKIKSVLSEQQLSLTDIQGVAIYKGPGSFTGLRIGISVANALAQGYDVPIVGSGGEDWILDCVPKLMRGVNERIVVPEYGAPVHITPQKK